MYRIGQGFDVHRFSDEAPEQGIMLGGILVPSSKSIIAHSDGDVVLHALCDALLGAAGLGDIGEHFADTDARFKNMNSDRFVSHVMTLLVEKKLKPVNVDITIIAEMPKVSPHKANMENRIAELLTIAPDLVNVKATTTETLGFTGRSEGVAAQVAVLLECLRGKEST